MRHLFRLLFSIFAGYLMAWVPVYLSAQTGLVLPYLQNATPASIVIMWETNVNTESIIQYGLTPDLGSNASGSSINTTGGTILHTVLLANLSSGTRYFYKAVTGSWQSQVYDFVTPPSRDSEADVNIVLMSDMQKDGGNPNIFSNLVNTSLLPYIADEYGSPLNDHLQMAVLPGDVVDNGNSYLQYKNDFFNPGQSLWSFVPSYPAIGNHEVNSVNYFNYFNLPANGTPGYLEHWYSHDYSNVRVLSFDTNTGYRINAQLTWLDSMLNVSCGDTLVDFVFAQMHHPYLSELWTPGNTDYTREIVERLEAFSDSCGKPTIHFFGHTHAYSRGQSRDHEHLWVNVASSGGNIDYWGEFDNQDYDEFIVSQDEYGFVMVEVSAGTDPKFTLKRLSFGDQYNPGGNTQTDSITVYRFNTVPNTPLPLYPLEQDTTSSFCVTLKATGFEHPQNEEHGSSHWQVSDDSADFSAPLFESWKQYANWYEETDLQAGDNLSDETASNLPAGVPLWWRVRYRDKGLTWSTWTNPSRFHTRPLDTLTANLILNGGAESGTTHWTATTGVIESLDPLQCAGINPFQGQKYFAVGALCVEYAFASAYQNIDVSAFAQPIDSGNVIAHYGAWLADYANTDEPSFALQFLNSGGNVISGTDTIRHRLETWTLKQQSLPVPEGTRTIRYIVMGKRFAGVDNDSYFDEIFLKLLEGNLSCSEYVAPGPANGRVYVDHDSPGYPDGESWITAYRNVSDALHQSNADTTVHEIWVAAGDYRPVTSTQRDSSFRITREVDVYGGFAGDETSVSQRDIQANLALLSGEIGNPALATDNSFHVIRIESTMDTVRIDGLSICCGYADQPGHSRGGGLYHAHTNREPLLLRDCVMENNMALEGSSVFNQGKMIIDHCTITDQAIPGTTTSSILNSGVFARLSLLESTLSQGCTTCTEVIRNINGATLTIYTSAEVRRD